MDLCLDSDIYTNDIQYFFSLHGPRFESMNNSMAVTLSKRFGKEFRPISIFNAWPSQRYTKPNYIVLNKRGYKIAKELGHPVISLPDYEDVNVEFAEDRIINEITTKLLKKQGTVFVFPFTTAFLNLPETKYTILGPNSQLAMYLDNKVNQFKLFKKLGLPCNNAQIYESEEELLKNEYDVIPCYLSASYTSGGAESGLIYSNKMLHEFLAKLRTINKHNSFIVSDIFEDIVLAPNISALVTSTGETYTLVIADQILQGNKYLGNIYPSKANKLQLEQINDMTKTIGTYLAGQGYKGLFGCDFLINMQGEIVVVDLNPRHQGGYACNGLALKSKGISITDLEIAVFFDEQIDPSLDKENPIGNVDYSWQHSKIAPSERGQQIHSEYQKGDIEETFGTRKTSFVSEFYKKGSVFIEGYVGYQACTGISSKHTSKIIADDRMIFDELVLKDQDSN